MFKTALLATFVLITKPGKYLLKAFTNTDDRNLVTDENGRQRHIISFRAVAQDKLAQLQQVFAGKDEVPIDQTNGLFLTANAWVQPDRAADLPMKSEEVECNVDYVPSRDGEQVLRITNYKRKPAEKASFIDLASLVVAEPSAPVGTERLINTPA